MLMGLNVRIGAITTEYNEILRPRSPTPSEGGSRFATFM
jgi:hypothetical protein